MRAWLVACVVLAGRAPVEALEAPVLRVAWSDPLDAAPLAFPIAAAEGARILRAVGIESVWREEGDRAIGGDEIHVVILPRDRTGRTAMGSTLRHATTRAAWIFVEAVEKALARPVRKGRWSRGPDVLAIALGRVAVHEVAHTLLPDASHAEDGVMRASLGPRDLYGGDVALDGRTAAALRALLREETRLAMTIGAP